MIEFPPFRLDLDNQVLWKGEHPVRMRTKAWALLRHLATHPGRLCTRDELLDAVWTGLAVTPANLNQVVLELRHLLDDDAREPRFIETVHGRGFRFVGRVRVAAGTEGLGASPLPHAARVEIPPGREREMAQLRSLLEAAQGGARQIVFLTGEAGIGKTRLVEAFLAEAAEPADAAPRVAIGHCIEQHGEREPYLPLLEAFDRLAREPEGEPVRRVLARYAPTWLAQMPWLEGSGEPRAAGPLMVVPARMLRELCVALESLTDDRTLLLWLEDLHWSDPSTIDLLAALAHRSDRARLMVVASYRPVDAAIRGQRLAALKSALLRQQRCHEIALELLSEDDVGVYLRRRLGAEVDRALTAQIFRQTEGSPLFVVTLVDQLLADGAIERSSSCWALALPEEELRAQVPESLAKLVEAQCESLGAGPLEMLEAGSVVGETFSAQAAAAMLDIGIDEAEARLGRLAGWRCLIESGGSSRWPDGTAGEQFRFLHSLFRRCIYRRIPAGRRQRWHRRLAERLEEAYASDAPAIAAEIALHFERGGAPDRAIPHLIRAATSSRQRFADRVAVSNLRHALGLLATGPESEPRNRRELELRLLLARALQGAVGFSASDEEENLVCAHGLAEKLDDAEGLSTVSSYQIRTLAARGHGEQAWELARRHRELEGRIRDPILLAQIHGALGNMSVWRGALAEAEAEHASVCRLEAFAPAAAYERLGIDPIGHNLVHSAVAAWLAGRPDTAEQRAALGIARAEAAGHPLGLCIALGLASVVAQLRRDAEAVRRLGLRLAECVAESGVAFPYPQFHMFEGWLLAQEGRLEEAAARLRSGLDQSLASGARIGASMLLGTLAEVELARAEPEAARAALESAAAFVEETGERLWEAELQRLRAELLRAEGDAVGARGALKGALALARGQGARSLELRCLTSLVRLASGRKTLAPLASGRKALALLARACDSFTEGLETGDLRDARTLLDAHGGAAPRPVTSSRRARPSIASPGSV